MEKKVHTITSKCPELSCSCPPKEICNQAKAKLTMRLKDISIQQEYSPYRKRETKIKYTK